MSQYYEFTFPSFEAKNEIVIAFLQQMEFEGFQEAETFLKAYIHRDHINEIAVKQVLFDLSLPTDFNVEQLPDTNWNEEWESNFKHIQVDDFCVIKADFHTVNSSSVEHVITINPKQAFGTGHHETTYMMIQQMRKLDLEGKQLLDIGTGTGILAILGEKLGAASILATENDPKAITNAKENISINKCDRIQVEDHLYELTDLRVDFILANINMNVLFDYADIIKTSIKENGIVLLSGILDSQLASVEKKYTSDKQLKTLSRTQKGEWCLLELICN